MYADEILVVKKDYNYLFVKTDDVLTEKLLSEIYKIPIEIINSKKYKICSPKY